MTGLELGIRRLGNSRNRYREDPNRRTRNRRTMTETALNETVLDGPSRTNQDRREPHQTLAATTPAQVATATHGPEPDHRPRPHGRHPRPAPACHRRLRRTPGRDGPRGHDYHGPNPALAAGDPSGTEPTDGNANRGDPRQRGFATAEMAAVLPAVVAVLALGLWAVATVGTKVRAIDAANSAAIAAARSEDPHAVAAAYLPDGASVTISQDDTLARAVVTVPVRPLGPLTPPMSITAAAAAPLEPGVT